MINSFQHTKGTLRSRRSLLKPKLINRKQQLTRRKLAASYLDSTSSDFGGYLAKIRRTRMIPSSGVNGILNNKGIAAANLFTEYYIKIYKSVGFDKEEMQLLYDNVCEKVSSCVLTNHCHGTNHASVSHSIHKLQDGKMTALMDKRLISN